MFGPPGDVNLWRSAFLHPYGAARFRHMPDDVLNAAQGQGAAVGKRSRRGVFVLLLADPVRLFGCKLHCSPVTAV